MLPKQKSYIPRFALLIHAFDSFFDVEGTDSLCITKSSILKAEKLSKYFISMAKKVKINSVEVLDLKTSAKQGKTTIDKLSFIYNENPNFNRTQTAEILGISRRQILNLIKKIEKK
jgi:hypothetical protein